MKEVVMIKIEPKSVLTHTSNLAKFKKNSNKLITVSSLGILAGSSMGPTIPPHDIKHVPGTSADDSWGDILDHTGDQLIDLGSTIGNGVTNFFVDTGSHIAEGITDCFHDVTERAASLFDKILDSLN